jgi:hypothetical protein
MKRRGWQLAVILLAAPLVGLGWWLQRSQPPPAPIGLQLEASQGPAVLDAGDAVSHNARFSQGASEQAPSAAHEATSAQAPSEAASLFSQRGGLTEEEPSYPSFGMERDGKPEGIWRTYDENGVLQSEVNYLAGVREGPFTQWCDNGTIQFRGTFSKDKENGRYESFHQSGAPLSTGQMLKGKQHGLWVTQANDGKLVSELTYVNGVLEGPCSFYTNGVLDVTRSGIYSKGKKTGQ